MKKIVFPLFFLTIFLTNCVSLELEHQITDVSPPLPTLLPTLTIAPVPTGAGTEQPPLPAGWSVHTNANMVTMMVFDHEGFLWTAGTGGLVRWDVENHTYTHYTHLGDLPSTEVTALAVAPDGTVWVGSNYQLVYFENEKWVSVEQYNYATDIEVNWGRNEIWDSETLPSNPLILGFDADQPTRLLLINGIYFLENEMWEMVPGSHGGVTGYIQGLQAQDQSIWGVIAGCCDAAVNKVYRSDGETIEHVPQADRLQSLTQTGDGTVWFSIPELGIDPIFTIISFDGHTWEMETGLEGTKLTTGPDGTLWFLNDNGVNHYEDGKITATYPFPSKFKENLGRGWRWSSSLIIGPENTPWIASRDHQGIWHFTGKSWEEYRGENQLPGIAIGGIQATPDGAIWVLTPRFINRYDGERWQSKHTDIRSGIVEDDKLEVCDDNVVFLTNPPWGSHPSYYYWDGEQINSYFVHPCNRLDGDKIAAYQIIEGGNRQWQLNDGTIWQTTWGGDSHIRSFDGEQWIQHQIEFFIPELIFLAPDGAIWITTRSDGLYRYQPSQ